MIISDLIHRLQAIQQVHGDLYIEDENSVALEGVLVVDRDGQAVSLPLNGLDPLEVSSAVSVQITYYPHYSR